MSELSKLRGTLIMQRRFERKDGAYWAQSNISNNLREENILADEDFVTIRNKFNDLSPMAGTVGLSLDNFFKRPVRLTAFNINSTDFTRVIKPYSLWSKDPSVRAKLHRYAYFRGDLRVRIVMTSNAFQYGSMLVSNQPFADANLTLRAHEDLLAAGITDLGQFKSYLSTSPEKVLMEYGTPQSYELVLPFISPKPVVRLYSTELDTILGPTDNYPEMDALSSLYLQSFNNLISTGASNFNTDVNVQIYGMCENVQLSVATGTDIDMSAQSDFRRSMDDIGDNIKDNIESKKDKYNTIVNSNPTLNAISNKMQELVPDEYDKPGPISTIASAVANVSSKLSSVPIIGDYAKATGAVAGSIAKVASFFGFSKPSQITNVVFHKNVPFGSSLAAGADTAYKLSTDPKQELSITPLGGEAPFDPMAINFITSREAFIGTVDWLTSAVPFVDTLVSLPIEPFTNLNNTNDSFGLTPMAISAMAFEYWRGTISFRIEVIASRFSKGKLMIAFEPNNASINLIKNKTTVLNEQMIYYMDLDQERVVNIDCGFVFDRAFARTRTFLNTPGLFPFTSVDDNNSTGSLIIKPLTRITGVEPLQPAYINIYVKSNDMEFAFPTNLSNANLNFNAFGLSAAAAVADPSLEAASTANSEFEAQSDLRHENVERREGSNIVSGKNIDINLAPVLDSKAYLYNFGERITSFRQLFKKDFMTRAFSFPHSSGNSGIIRVPLYPDFGANLTPKADFIIPGVLDIKAAQHVFGLIRNCYLFSKGGFRKRFQFYGTGGQERSPITVAMRNSFYNGNHRNILLNTVTIPTSSVAGTALFHRETNEGIEVEIPHFSNNLFEPTIGHINYTLLGDAELHFNQALPIIDVFFQHDHDMKVYQYESAAEDFTFFRFQGVPSALRNKEPTNLFSVFT